MAVYKRSYRPYMGPLTSERWRFLVVARYALQELVESRVLMTFVVMCLFPFLAEAVGIYVANSEAARALLRVSGGPDPMRTEFFAGTLTVQGAITIFDASTTRIFGAINKNGGCVLNGTPLELLNMACP